MAWWEYGHETVARIAWLERQPAHPRRDRPAAARRSRLLDTPTCPARTIELASYWPDCIKTLGERFSYASPWHYQNVDICRPFDQAAACRDGNCVSAQIERNVRLLADRALPARERLMALAFLVHFMGDLHQPMHAGDHGDLGGNRVRAPDAIGAALRRDRRADQSPFDLGRLSRRPRHLAAAGRRRRHPFRARARPTGRRCAQGGVADWARESWEASREFAYGTIMADPCGAAAGRAAGDHRGDHRGG